VREALLLRRWALGVLFHSADPAATRELAGCTGKAWKLMLDVELCALPLLSALKADIGEIPEEGLRVLRAQASLEIRSALSARQQCAEIGRMAKARGWSLVALKGVCPPLKGSGSVGLADVDLLCSSEGLDEVRAALLGMGYREDGKAAAHHVPSLVKDGGLPLELHFAIPGVTPPYDVWSGVERDPGGSGLFFLRPVDQVWHLLVECVVHHPHRRGRLRDLWLLAAAAGECSEGDLREVEARIASNPYAEPLRALLEMAIEAAAGRAPTDRFPVTAAASYLWVHEVPRLRLPHTMVLHAHAAVFTAVGGAAPGRLQWARSYMRLGRPSKIRALRRVEDASPRWGGLLRHGVSVLPVWAMAPVSLLLAARARRVCRSVFPRLPLPLFTLCGAALSAL
jgi:hypothetical protein